MSTPHAISSIRFAFGACAVVAAASLAAAALFGIETGAPLLASLARGLPAMKPTAAIEIIGASGAWLLLHSRPRSAQSVGFVLSAAVALVAAATLIEHVSGIDFGFDDLILHDAAGGASGHPGRMSIASSVALLLAAVALMLTRPTSSRAEDVRQFARLGGLAVTLFALALHVYDSEALSVIYGFEATALSTSLALTLLLLAIGYDRTTASLRWQVAHIGVVVIAPLAALTVHFASAEREIALLNASARLSTVAQLGGERQDAVITQARQLLDFIARSPAIRSSDPTCGAELINYAPLNPSVRAIFTVGRDGLIRCSGTPGTVSMDVTDRDYFKQAFGTGKFTVSEYFLSRTNGQPRIAAALPMKGAGDEDLLLVATLDLGALGDLLEQLSSEGDDMRAATMTLVDKNGVVIARRPAATAKIGANISDATFVTQALADPDRTFEAAELDGRSTVFAAQRVLMGQGTLIVGLPKGLVVGPVDVRLNYRLLLISVILAVSLTLGVIASEALVMRPLRRLIAYAGKLEDGDLAARPDVKASGEVGALGRALAMTAAAIEDRERRLAATEALFRGLFDHSPDAKAVVRVESEDSFRIETWNAAAVTFSGLTAAEVLGRRPREVFPGARGESIERDLQRTLSLGRVVTVERESTINGVPTVFEMVEVPMLSAEGKIERIFLSARDISERKRVERLKNEFVSTVSHELRTPLTSIAGSLGLLSGGAAGPLGEKARHLIQIAHSNSLRLVRLINDILDIEKIEAGRMTFELKTLVVVDLVEQAISGLKGYADDFGVMVEVVPGGEGLMVRGDMDRLTQVVTNLLSNAIKFSPRGEVVHVGIAADDEIVSIAVRDRGPGIPEGFRPRVFAKFAQADGSDSRRKGGTGLGLAIVREIVERHAGAVSYKTEIGEGTEFQVRLPRHHVGGRTPAIFSEAPEKATILICEDDQLVATILVEQMRDAGFDAVTVGTVREARQAIEARDIDAVLVDLNLPDGDGIGLIRDLRASKKAQRVPIVVVSADAGRGRSDARAAALDVTAWLEKPVDTRRLAGLLQRRLKPSPTRPRILHVEDDADLCNVVSAAVAPLADVVSVGSLEGARRELERNAFDLAIIDVTLEDGSGLDLLTTLESRSPRPIPAVIFSARDIGFDVAPSAEASITKSRTSLSTLVDTIRRLIAGSRDGQASDGAARERFHA